MSSAVKVLLTIVLCTVIPAGLAALVLALVGVFQAFLWLFISLAIFGLLYGLEAGILTIYDLGSGRGWGEMLIDLTWSLPNTVFGFLFGNLIYIFFGNPSRSDSRDAGWIVFQPRSSTGFGNNVLQTLGTVNIGGAGQHEKMHLLQARIFGPLYLPLIALSYVVTFLIQLLWTITLGWILWLANARPKPYLEPPASSAVGGFFGWIYYYTPHELWAYASGNP